MQEKKRDSERIPKKRVFVNLPASPDRIQHQSCTIGPLGEQHKYPAVREWNMMMNKRERKKNY